ncbi:hypothetical protein I4U23_029425 [Adineta vaga]|nr:hypothetical protein I4U23_029425 [Adineta vaga]
MENTIDTREEQIEYHYIEDRDHLHYPSTATHDHSDHLPPKHIPVEHHPNLDRARILLTSDVPTSRFNKDDEVLIRDTIVQHISEDEKSTSSEEVVFEEWSEEFRCRRTEEFDKSTYKLIRTTIDETSERVKSDVIKEEYKEKNERIKGHKSYDVVKEVYRRVPAHTVDPTKTVIVDSVDQSQSHMYEEISQAPSSIRRPRSSSPVGRKSVIEHVPHGNEWSSEDIYTTEIVYDAQLAQDIESSTRVDNIDRKFDSKTPPQPQPPSLSSNYDRVRPGQYPPMPSTNQAIISTVPSSNYDRISNIVTSTTHLSERRPAEREDHVSEEYEVEFEHRQSDRRSPSSQRQTSNFGMKQQRDETSEEEVSDPYVITGDNSYGGLTTIINEAGRRRDSDWRQKLKEVYTPTSDDERFDQAARSRETSKHVISMSRTDDERPQPPKRSSSSSSIIDERRARFEQQQQFDSSSGFSTNVSDRPTFGRVGELKNAFESTTNGSTRDDISKFRTTITPGLTEQRRRLFEDQEQTTRRPVDEFLSNERRMSETHSAPSRVSTIKSTLESSSLTTKQIESLPTTHSKVDVTIKDKRTISSVDSDVSGASPPIYQSTPKSTKQNLNDDAGHESEDELSDPTNKQEQQYDQRRRQPKTRLRDFSQSTSQPGDTTYLNQRTKSSFTETNMENILSHVPASKGKGLLIELSPHISHNTPITSATTKSIRDPYKSTTGSDSGIFEYSTATSQQQPQASSTSWRNNISIPINDDANRSQTIRDSGVYADSTATTTPSQRYGRRQASDTDQTTIHGGDDSVSRSTFRYDTEIISSDQLNQSQQQQQQRNIHRQTTRSPSSNYETIANYHSGINSQRRVPITTESRSIRPKPLVVDEIETIETETLVECQVQRTHEIKESTTKTERSGSPGAPKKTITTTTTTTTTTAAPTVRSPESSSDEIIRTTTTPSKRVFSNEGTQYYDLTKNNDSPIAIRSRPESSYTPTKEIRQQTQTYRETGIHEHRLDSPQSDVISYPLPPSKFIQQDESGRIEETWFKPIQRDRSQDSLRHSPSSRSNVRTLSAGPRAVEVTSLSPQNQVTFGKYSPNQIIAIVRVPELSNGNNVRPSPSIRHGASESELYVQAKQEAEQQEQRSRLQYQRVQASSYRPPSVSQEYQQRQSRSRTGPYEITNEYSSPLGAHTRSSSYHSALHDQDSQQQQDQDEYPYSSHSGSAHRRQTQRRSGSLGNLFGPNIEFEIEIEKRPPQQPGQPTVVSLDQPTRAIVTSSKDGRVSIRNVAARPGNTVVINSDFHSSDRSLNRSSGYFSSDELRSQGLNTNYSSDEQSSGAGMNMNQQSQSSNTPSSTHPRRYKNNEQGISKLPSHYRPKQQNHYQQLNNENFDQVNRIVNRYSRQSNSTTGFNEAIDQIDKLYNNLDVHTDEDYITGNNPVTSTPTSTYDFSKPTSTMNRRKHLSQNANDYTKRYSSTGFQHDPSQYEQEIMTSNSNTRHLISPPTTFSNEKRRNDTTRALSDNENLNTINEHNRRWGSTSLNDLVMATPIRPSQSLSSSGILADYGTPGSISPNSGFGSTQNVILQQNRLNGQSQIVQRNRTSVKQVKQKSAAKKRTGNIQGQYSDEEDDNDSIGDHDSPLSDTGRPQPPSRSSNRHQ